jgi:hypothetical protein
MMKRQPATCLTRSAPALVVQVYVNVVVSLECSNEAPSRSTFPCFTAAASSQPTGEDACLDVVPVVLARARWIDRPPHVRAAPRDRHHQRRCGWPTLRGRWVTWWVQESER